MEPTLLKMMFLFPKWDMLGSCWVFPPCSWFILSPHWNALAIYLGYPFFKIGGCITMVSGQVEKINGDAGKVVFS